MDGQRVNEWGVDGWLGGRKDGYWIIGWRKGRWLDGRMDVWIRGQMLEYLGG